MEEIDEPIIFSPQELINMMNALIIDNNTQQVSPAKLRMVFTAFANAIGAGSSSPSAGIYPIKFDPFNGQISFRPIQYGELRIKSKYLGNNSGITLLQVNDIVEGWADATTYWDSAIYNGGDPEDRASYTALVQTNEITINP